MSTAAQEPRSTIGPYRIVARVGAGGMGEVFKAWDPRLERDVAIKLLHPEAAGDAARQRRLLAEGRAASALNHPNILRVYDADVDGQSYYLVSEWLEGKSLRDELTRGPMALRRLLDLAVQIADGLAAAHANGIVHRDIKPDNIMLARDGTARIVDFGLARSDPHAPSAVHHSAHAATVSLDGGLSGTPGYMSPEQARGTPGDFRTDQFSFGALLYEMATGRHAFRRDSITDTLSAVVHEEPRPIADLNPRIPAPVRWTIERCLAKDAGERYSATDDLARELRLTRDRLAEALAEPKPDAAPSLAAPWKLPASIAAAAVIGAIGMLLLTGGPPVAPALRFVPVATASVYEGEPAWSPDGQSIAYTADVNGVLQIFVKRAADAVSRPLTQGQFDASHPFWSTNGERVYYISQAGEFEALWSVGVAGGRPEIVLENVTRAAIDPDGSRLALLRDEPEFALRQSLWWSSPPGAPPQRETRAPFDTLRTGGDGLVRFSGDGQLLVWIYDVDTISIADPTQSSGFYLVPKGDGAIQRVLTSLDPGPSVPAFDWWPDNRQIIVGIPEPGGGNRHLWFADTRSNAARPITWGHTNETVPAVAPISRRIAYASEEVDFDLNLISPDGRTRSTILATARNELDAVWSPKGDQFAFVTDRSGSIEIWARSRDGMWERPIVTPSDFGTSRTETLGSLAFSPDGKSLAYQRGSEGTWDLWLSPVTGGAPVRLTSPPGGGRRPWRDAPTWSPDGEWIAYVNNDFGTELLVKSRFGASETVELLRGAVVAFSRPAWSPDGLWIAVLTDEGLVRVPAGGGRAEQIAAEQVRAMTWRPGGRQIVALTESETPGHFAMIEFDTQTKESRVLNPDLGSVPIAYQPIRGLSFAEGQGFLTSLASARSDIWLIEGVQPPESGLWRWFRR
ncbi:MAG TPA: protein kinase [Vicinamibacterales bacterium]|nr:protein kinase [Vicinamibacterales bacterium]